MNRKNLLCVLESDQGIIKGWYEGIIKLMSVILYGRCQLLWLVFWQWVRWHKIKNFFLWRHIINVKKILYQQFELFILRMEYILTSAIELLESKCKKQKIISSIYHITYARAYHGVFWSIRFFSFQCLEKFASDATFF